jgi:hypothetical protein
MGAATPTGAPVVSIARVRWNSQGGEAVHKPDALKKDS